MLTAASLVLTAGAASGCQNGYEVEDAPAPTHLAHFDEAIELRNWQQSSSLYANGDVWAGPTNTYYTWPVGDPADSAYNSRQRAALVAEPLLALGQFLALPVTLIIDPPTEKRLYEGVEVGPTYTAAVPPEELQRETSQGRRNLQRAQRQQRKPQPVPSSATPAQGTE